MISSLTNNSPSTTAVIKIIPATNRKEHVKLEHWRRPLTERETHIVKLIAQGKTNKDIGSELCISWKTVKTHVRNIGLVVGCGRREVIVYEATKAGIIENSLPNNTIIVRCLLCDDTFELHAISTVPIITIELMMHITNSHRQERQFNE